MEKSELKLYRVIPKYIKYLQDEEQGGDKRVYGKDNRAYIGILVVCNNKKYCVPLTTKKEKFANMKGKIDFGLIKDDENNIIAGIEYSRMIPVEEHLLRPLDMLEHPHDTKEQKVQKQIRQKEYDWCQLHSEDIINKVNVLYNTYISGTPFKARNRCLNYPQLESVCQKYCELHPKQHKTD